MKVRELIGQVGARARREVMAAVPRHGAILLLAMILGAWGSATCAQAVDYLAVSGDAAGAVIAGRAGAVYFSSGNHTSFLPSQVPDLQVDLSGAANNGEDTYFVVGGGGTILVSSGAHGSAFVLEESPTQRALYGVARFQSSMVAIGDRGAMVRSASLLGGGWTQLDSLTENALHDLVRGLSLGIAVGEQGTVLMGNTVGAAWALVSPSPAPGADLHGVTVLTDNRFLVVGSGGTVVRGHADGMSWELLGSPAAGDLYDVAEKPGTVARIVAVGEGGRIFTSTNAGEGWTEAESPAAHTLRSVVYTGTDFFAVGDNATVIRSFDGVTWWSDLTPVRKKSWGTVKDMFR